MHGLHETMCSLSAATKQSRGSVPCMNSCMMSFAGLQTGLIQKHSISGGASEQLHIGINLYVDKARWQEQASIQARIEAAGKSKTKGRMGGVLSHEAR